MIIYLNIFLFLVLVKFLFDIYKALRKIRTNQQIQSRITNQIKQK
ncbi:MAG: hypothetical protein RL264_2086 [Bacteroidota bacterium]|jgi:hypothetical protein